MPDSEQIERFVCVHAHFHQTPRESPWLESIELQDSAYPYHDWNERTALECYAPNAAARILDGEGRIVRIVNNYSRISFDFSPALLRWLADRMPEIYGAVLEADSLSRDRFGGHGSALAQVYNHMILPLAERRDKECQILWGLRDFEQRFGRPAEGMWLPETAVDLESLELLLDHGIRFTILSPSQARRTRARGIRAWRDVSGGRIDPSQAYEQSLPSGRRIVLFFWDAPISRGVASEGLLRDGGAYARRMLSGFSEDRQGAQLVPVVTDGEHYGLHHRRGEMALAYALETLETGGEARLTNFAEFLARRPPQREVDLFPDTSRTCAHGVERWRSDCGCSTGAHPGWNQGWRRPLREALDWLRGRLVSAFEEVGHGMFADPWKAREDYVSVILDRSPEVVEAFLERNALPGAERVNLVKALQVLEMMRHGLLMYESGGWFYDDLSASETVQDIQYAGRALQLAAESLGLDLEDEFLARLAAARSNLPDQGDGVRIYERWVRPAMVDLPKLGAHYAVSSFFQEYPPLARIHAFEVERKEQQTLSSGASRVMVGTIRVTSRITREQMDLIHGFLHLGDHNLTGGVRPQRGEADLPALLAEASAAFAGSELVEVIRALERNLGELTYSLRSIFRDEQRGAIARILESSVADVASVYGGVYERFVPLMRFLSTLGYPNPEAFRAAASVVLHRRIRAALESEVIDPEQVRSLLEEATAAGVHLDEEGLGYLLARRVERALRNLRAHPDDPDAAEAAERDARVVGLFPFPVELWIAENLYYEHLREQLETHRALAAAGDEAAARWLEHFLALGEILHIRVAP